MKQLKLFTATLLVLCLLLPWGAYASASRYKAGDMIEDFTITTYDGRTITLSDVLAEKEMVFINIWATWCGPCRMEMPHMEEIYRQYGDRIEIIALSSESSDTDEKLAAFASENNLTFPITRDTLGFSAKFNATSIPTSAIVDRFGRICYIYSGALTGADAFRNIFEPFLGDGYTESLILNGTPVRSTVDPSAETELAAALGGSLVFRNPASEYIWPMTAAEKDGRTVLMSSNKGKAGTTASVYTTVDAKPGDALAVSFSLSTSTAINTFRIKVNGETVKSFSGMHDWSTYAVPFDESGTYEISLSYNKLNAAGSGEDTLWIDSVTLLSGEEAAAAVAANPVYPVSDAVTMAAVNPESKRIVIEADDDSGIFDGFFSGFEMYIVGDTSASVLITLPNDVDPEAAAFVSDYNNALISPAACMTENGYEFSAPLDTVESTGYPYTTIQFYPTVEEDMAGALMLFADEAQVDAFIEQVLGGSEAYPDFTWRYADKAETPSFEKDQPTGDVAYVIRYVDQNGDPVSGVMCQVCDDSVCMVYVSDENGVCSFSLPGYEYEIHLLMPPEGYTGDTEAVAFAPSSGGEIEFVLEKQ